MWNQHDARRSRRVTCELLDLAEQGVISWETLARDALGWMSEAEVAEFAQRNDYLETEGLTDEEVEDLMDNPNYVGSRHHY
jgi:hypothetical protein